MWHTGKPQNRKQVGGIMLSAALTSFLTGFTCSHGFIDFFLFYNLGTRVWLILVFAPFFAALYYFSLVVGLNSEQYEIEINQRLKTPA